MWSINLILRVYAGLFMLLSVVIGVGLTPASASSERKRPPKKVILKTCLQSVKAEKSILVAVMGNASAVISSICIYSYGIPVYQQ